MSLSTNDSSTVTPGRRTHIKFDIDEPYLVEPGFSIERLAPELARTSASRRTNVQYVKGVGWMLKPYFEKVAFYSERTEAGNTRLLPSQSNLTVAAGFQEVKGWRAPTNTEMPKVADGASGMLMASGHILLQKSVSSGSDWNAALSADQTAIPSPASSDDTLVMDRVAVSTEPDKADKSLVFIIYIPGAVQHSAETVATLYFVGPAGSDESLVGIGQYALKLSGDGRARLYERKFPATSVVWSLRYEFRYAKANEVTSRFHSIVVHKALHRTFGSGPGGTLVFKCATSDGESTAVYAGIASAMQALTLQPQELVYSVPRLTNTSPMPQETSLRVDIRRDIRAKFGVMWESFPATGELKDDVFVTEFWPTSGTNFYLEWNPVKRSGVAVSDLVLSLHYADDDSALTLVDDRVPLGKNYREYAFNNAKFGKNAFYIKATFTRAGSLSPILKSWKVYKDARVEITSNGVKEFAVLRRLSITGAERDVSHESADAVIANLAGDATVLGARASIPTLIETEYDAADTSKRCKLFRGYTTKINAHRRGTSRKEGLGGVGATVNFPNSAWKELAVEFIGSWQRLFEQVAEVRQIFFDYEAELPMKVTDAIVSILSGMCGFPSYMLDIPDLPVRLFSMGESPKMLLEPLSCLGDVLLKMIEEYLGHFLVFDPNAGTYGKWRLIAPQTSPYTNVAAFTTSGPGAGKLQMYLPSYPANTAPIIKGTLQTYVKPPEANMIVVSTINEVSTGTESRLTTVLVNPKSYNFFTTATADPTHPDYLGRLVKLFVMNPSIIGGADSEEACVRALNWVARRIYDVSAHAIKMASFQAPLLLIDHDEAGKKRPLRYYDPVTIDGQQFLIRNVNPAYEKDHIQVAMYECEAPRI